MGFALLFPLMLGASALGASGMSLAVTEYMNIQTNGTTTVQLKAVSDDQLYQFVKTFNSSFFDLKNDSTWSISRKTNENNDHIFEATTTVKTDDIDSALSDLRSTNAGSAASTFVFSPAITKASTGFAKNRWTIHADVNPPMNSWMGTIASSAVQFHYEINPPGAIISSNGEQKSDGSISWSIPLGQPSTIDLISDASCIPFFTC
ncbi:MAG TPA: hypothetical protein VGZ00_11475 [Candidatus Baltobacteraceae bacterium]|nr:hypothetical protein [Candidatus Baltobacteraceae bacterium]